MENRHIIQVPPPALVPHWAEACGLSAAAAFIGQQGIGKIKVVPGGPLGRLGLDDLHRQVDLDVDGSLLSVGLDWSGLVWYDLVCTGLIRSGLLWSGLPCFALLARVCWGLLCAALPCSALLRSILILTDLDLSQPGSQRQGESSLSLSGDRRRTGREVKNVSMARSASRAEVP